MLAAVAYRPAGQMAQAARVVPGLETPKPSAQNAQAASEVLSEASVRTPVGQLVHVEAPAAEYVFAEHAAQPAAAVVPEPVTLPA